ncbi:hypothetical protein [Brevibacillus massiliensis]|uniref:hypothetical protein n=1 Tax=Brevibacillus massiliensis TaxID=1118054 RepID=UPI0011CB6299|nr:hypothetical protein [Brevibacillus massiliensis]
MARLRTDIVVIEFRRVVRAGVRLRIIQAVRVIGSAFPCRRFLMIGNRVGPAQRCLLANGFRLVVSSRNVLIFVRRR